MTKQKLARSVAFLLFTVGLMLTSLPAYSATHCEQMTDDQLRHALNQELAALEKDNSLEDDQALEKDIEAALKSGTVIDYQDLEQTMADDEPDLTVEEVVHEAVLEADQQDSQGVNLWAPSMSWLGVGLPTPRGGRASRARGATDAVEILIQKADEARVKHK